MARGVLGYSNCLLALLLVASTALQPSVQLPVTTSRCDDPLQLLAPDPGTSKCAGPTAYLMSASSEFAHCPARSVCPSASETAACAASLLTDLGHPSDCPTEAPLRLLEYYPPMISQERQLFSTPPCPLRFRCAPLSCFDEFCRARQQGRGVARVVGAESAKPALPSSYRPILMRNGSRSQCEFLHCGCPLTEADLLAEGCPSAGQILILRADPLNGCPAKLCTVALPSNVEPLLPPSPAGRNADAGNSSAAETDCDSRQAAHHCPTGTSELTVPNPVPGLCPLRICLLPELLNNASAASSSEPTSVTSAAATELPLQTPGSTESATSSTTTLGPSLDITTAATISSTTSVPATESTTTTADTTTSNTIDFSSTVAPTRDWSTMSTGISAPANSTVTPTVNDDLTTGAV